MTEQFTYLSAPWFAQLQLEAERAQASRPATVPARDFVLVERYTGRPGDWPWAQTEPGFRISFSAVGGARVRPGARADEAADCRLEMSWDAACRVVSQPGGAALDALLAGLVESGDLRIEGSLADFPFDLNAFHDAMVALTRLDEPLQDDARALEETT